MLWCGGRGQNRLCITQIEVYVVIIIVLLGRLVVLLLAVRLGYCRGRLLRGRGGRSRGLVRRGGGLGTIFVVVPRWALVARVLSGACLNEEYGGGSRRRVRTDQRRDRPRSPRVRSCWRSETATARQLVVDKGARSQGRASMGRARVLLSVGDDGRDR